MGRHSDLQLPWENNQEPFHPRPPAGLRGCTWGVPSTCDHLLPFRAAPAPDLCFLSFLKAQEGKKQDWSRGLRHLEGLSLSTAGRRRVPPRAPPGSSVKAFKHDPSPMGRFRLRLTPTSLDSPASRPVSGGSSSRPGRPALSSKSFFGESSKLRSLAYAERPPPRPQPLGE